MMKAINAGYMEDAVIKIMTAPRDRMCRMQMVKQLDNDNLIASNCF